MDRETYGPPSYHWRNYHQWPKGCRISVVGLLANARYIGCNGVLVTAEINGNRYKFHLVDCTWIEEK